MLLKRRVEASVILYALVMMLLFSIVLTYYVERIKVERQSVEIMKIEQESYAMARLIYDDVLRTKKCHKQSFNLGSGDCKIKGTELVVTIQHHLSKQKLDFDFQLNGGIEKNLIR
jgi:hypothetical protein